MTKGEGESREPSIHSGDTLGQEKTVGELLLEAREKAALSLEDVSEETKIPKRMLEYLETDNFEAFPARVYARGFLKTYASLLGLDVEYVLNKFEVQTTHSHKSRGDMWEIETEVIEESVSQPAVLKKAMIAVAVIVAIILIVKMISNGEKGTAPPEVRSMKEELLGREGGGEGAVSPGVRGDAKGEAEKDEAIRKVGVEAEGSASMGKGEAGGGVPGRMELVITAGPSDSVWFEIGEVSSLHGTPDTNMYNFLLLPGQRRIFRATDFFYIRKVGNAGGFRMVLDGEELPVSGPRGAVRKNIVIGKKRPGG